MSLQPSIANSMGSRLNAQRDQPVRNATMVPMPAPALRSPVARGRLTYGPPGARAPAACPDVETVGTTAHQIVLSCRHHEYQTVAGQRGAADMERPRTGTCGGDRPVAVLGGVGMVYPVLLSEKQPQDHAMVFRQDPSELSRCVGRIAKGAVAETNYYNVRQSYRTCTNYRVLYRCRSYGCIIIYKKCESSLSMNCTYKAYIDIIHLFTILFSSSLISRPLPAEHIIPFLSMIRL